MKKSKAVLKELGINTFIAVKKSYNECVNANDFYKMLNRRTHGIYASTPKELANFLRHELHYHFKEFSQYQ